VTRTSSGRVGPTYDTLRVVVQPWPGQTTYIVTRLHFDGRQRRDTHIGSGVLPIGREGLETATAEALLRLVVEALAAQAKPPAPPQGDMGE
jgi:hypothetical protein